MLENLTLAEVATVTTPVGVVADTGGVITIGTGIVFGAFASANSCHAQAIGGGRINFGSGYQITGSATTHIGAYLNGIVQPSIGLSASSVTITLVGTPTFTQFALAESCGSIYLPTPAVSFSGSATGGRYQAILNGVINTNGGGANFFPGNTSGSTATGGQYN